MCRCVISGVALNQPNISLTAIFCITVRLPLEVQDLQICFNSKMIQTARFFLKDKNLCSFYLSHLHHPQPQHGITSKFWHSATLSVHVASMAPRVTTKGFYHLVSFPSSTLKANADTIPFFLVIYLDLLFIFFLNLIYYFLPFIFVQHPRA